MKKQEGTGMDAKTRMTKQGCKTRMTKQGYKYKDDKARMQKHG